MIITHGLGSQFKIKDLIDDCVSSLEKRPKNIEVIVKLLEHAKVTRMTRETINLLAKAHVQQSKAIVKHFGYKYTDFN